MTTHACVTGKIDVSRRCLNNVTAPEGRVAIAQSPPRKMFRRDARHSKLFRNFRALPPIKFCDIRDFVSIKKRAIPQTGYKARSMVRVQTPDCLDVQMIVVIMSDQHEIDWRQALKPQSGRSMSLGTSPRDRTRASRPNRIGKNV